MTQLREEEERARRIIQRHLGRPVEPHDDNSGTSKFDLRVGPIEAPEVAIEVTGAMDEEWVATWNTGQARAPRLTGVPGNWMIQVRPGASFREMERKLPRLLADVQARGLREISTDDIESQPDLYERIQDLRIDYAAQSSRPGSGDVSITMTGQGGIIDSAGSQVTAWLDAFLSDPRRADVLKKLGDTAAPQREVFIAVDLSAPWEVVSYLTDIARRGVQVPSEHPVLPKPVTGVWLVSIPTFGDGLGVRWDGHRWSTFETRD